MSNQMNKEGNLEDRLNESLNESLKEHLDQIQSRDNENKEHRVRYKGFDTDERKSSHQKKPKKKIRVGLIILIVIVALIVGAVAAFFVMRTKGANELKNTDITADSSEKGEEEQEYIVYNGQKYCYNNDMTTILCIGIDTDEIDDSDEYRSGYMADTIFLMAIDTEHGSATMIPISRYTMTDVRRYGTDGSPRGVANMQIAYSYAYGDGKDASGKNTAWSVSNIMHGIPIAGYYAMDMSGISVLNNAVGGVTVTVNEDMTRVDPEFFAGNTITLTDQQALNYVHHRVNTELTGEKTTEIDANAPRVERQMQYLSALLKKTLSETRSNPSLPLNMFNVLSDYSSTDVTAAEVTYLATLLARSGLETQVVSLPSTAAKGEKYTEVTLDDDGVYEVLLDVFYDKVDN